MCDNDTSREREALLDSTGMEFLRPAWANESATGLIRWPCGYVRLFVDRDLRLCRKKRGH